MSQSAMKGEVMVAVMGATGTGKSTFIRHLTNDSGIHINNDIDSKTSNIQAYSYIDAATGRSITLIDSPGFDDSREGITDMDILQRIIDFLKLKECEGKKLNGIIYLHRISDPRVGLTRKNLLMFEAMCGEESLPNVCLVTTYWDDEDGKGPAREDELKEGPFKSLLASGARMYRYLNTPESARAIMAVLIPLPEVTTQIQEEVAEDIPLGETKAGHIIDEEIKVLKKKHEKETAILRRLLEQAVRDQGLRAELEAEGKILQEKIMRTEEDEYRLVMTLPRVHEQQQRVEEAMKQLRVALAEKAAELKKARANTKKVEREFVELKAAELKKGMANTKKAESAKEKPGEPEMVRANTEFEESKQHNGEAEHYAKLGVFGKLPRDLADVTQSRVALARAEKKKHENELASLWTALEQAGRDRRLRAKLRAEGKILQEKIMRAEEEIRDSASVTRKEIF